MMPRRMTSGFTLIELLVVLAIIGILSGIVLASLNSARVAARDAQRASDIKQLQNAFELYANANSGQYPTTPPTEGEGEGMVVNMDTGTANITPYISSIPLDPTYTSSNGYRYRVGPNRRGYTMLVHLEKNSGAWCNVTMAPGDNTWSTTYPSCTF